MDDVYYCGAGNPLACGCDIAWLVLNTRFLAQLKDDTTCSDGELVVNLDPDLFIYCTKDN